MNSGNRRRRPSRMPGLLSVSLPKRPSFSKRVGTVFSPPAGPLEKQASGSYLVLFVLLSILCCGGLIYHLHLRFEGVRLGYETSRIRAERARLVAEQRELSLELSSLKSPERIESEAREKLGMGLPDLDQIVPMEKRSSPVLASGRAR